MSGPIVGIAAKVTNPHAVSLLRDLVQWLNARKIDLRIDDLVASPEVRSLVPAEKFIPRRHLTSHSSPVVVLGGDGTLISTSRYPVSPSPTVIGVNVGTLGFLTEITADELFPTLERVLAGGAQVESRSLLHTSVVRDGKVIREYPAINDVVITKDALARLFNIQLTVDGLLAATISGDGVIISTPVGSTAYSLSAGGSIVHPRVSALLVTPICPHSLTSRPLVLPGKSKLVLRLVSHGREEDDRVFLTIDGQEGMALEPEDSIEVATSDFGVLLAKSPSKSYFEVLGSKLKWGTQ